MSRERDEVGAASGEPTSLERLALMDLQALRELWRSHYGEPPGLRSRQLLRRVLAWRLQVHPGDPDVRALRAILGVVSPSKLAVGAVLAREWKGVRHEVEVVQDGELLYAGELYASLSAVARAITGVRWNGPRFFGLREEAA